MSILSSKASVGALLNDSSTANAGPTSNVHHPSLTYMNHAMPRLRQPSPPPPHSQMPPPSLPPSSAPSASMGATSPVAKKKHVCPTCEKGFTTSGHLARHARVHTGERNHRCPFPGCETRCSRQDNLQQHYRIHLSPGSRRSSSSATRAAMNRAMEIAQAAASQSSSSSPEAQSPLMTGNSTISVHPLPSMPPSESGPGAINPLNSTMVGGGGGASTSSSPASTFSAVSGGFGHSADLKRSQSNPLALHATSHSSYGGNALGLHSVPTALPNGTNYQHSQTQNYFAGRPQFNNTQTYSASNPNSAHTTPHMASMTLGGQSNNSPVSPANSVSSVSPATNYTPVHANGQSSYAPTDSPPRRLPPIQPSHQMTYPPPVPRSHSSHPYYASPYTPSTSYPVTLGMAGAGMGPSWKDGLAMHVSGGSHSLGMSAVGAGSYTNSGDYRRR